MDLRKVKKLIELLEDSALVEMEIREGENTIRLSRGGVVAASPGPAPVAQVHNAVAPVAATPAPAVATSVSEAAPAQVEGTVVASPMVGTYYDSSSPEAEPFVKVGDTVSVGDALCIVEAMKTFNQIDAETSGVIKAVHKSTGDPVEYGEPLFVIG